MKKLLAVILGFVLFLGHAADAAIIELPQTGQTTCYDSAGNPLVSCLDTGQDGDWKAGVVWPNARFTSGAGALAECVTDNLTGLIWVKTPDSTTRTWQGAIDYAKGLSLCGSTDWRVPSIIELESLVNTEQSDSAIWLNTQGFSNVQSGDYWTSTTLVAGTSSFNVLGVHMNDGSVGYTYNYKADSYYVWLVRGGQSGTPNPAYPANIWQSGQKTCYNTSGTVITCAGTEQDGDLRPGVAWPNPRFSNNDNGTVADNLTGLIWLKNANCFGAGTWDQALASANNLASGQCSLADGSQAGDWRLPNRKELLSLVDFEYQSPTLSNAAGTAQWSPGDPFDQVVSSPYWASTTSATSTGNAWYVFMEYGRVLNEPKTNSTYVWPVRVENIKVYDDGDWSIYLANDTGPGASNISVSIGGVSRGLASEIKIARNITGNSPQVFSIKGNGYLRSAMPDGDWGTSFVTTGYWRDSVYKHGLKIASLDINVANDKVTLSGTAFDDLADPYLGTNNYVLTLLPPTTELLEADVQYTLTAQKAFSINASRQAEHQGLKIAQFSSMYIDSSQHDSNTATYVDSLNQTSNSALADQNAWVFASTSLLGGDGSVALIHSDESPRNTPTTAIQIISPSIQNCTPQGWITQSTEPNDDNVGLWINWDLPSNGLTFSPGDTIGLFSYRLKTLCPGSPVKRGSVPHSSLQDAYDKASAGDAIVFRSLIFAEDLSFARPISVTISGGYNCDYSYNSQLSLVRGSLTIKNGTVIVDKVAIQ